MHYRYVTVEIAANDQAAADLALFALTNAVSAASIVLQDASMWVMRDAEHHTPATAVQVPPPAET